MKKVLYVSSREGHVHNLCDLSRDVWQVEPVDDFRNLSDVLSSVQYDFVFFDFNLDGVYAPDVLFQITSTYRHPPVFVLSEEESFHFCSLSLKAGVLGYFHIPYDFQLLERQVNRFLEAAGVSDDLYASEPDTDILERTIIGKSQVMKQLRQDIRLLRSHTEPVLITGETGSGKELVAKMIHSCSPVSTGPYAILNSSCIPSTLAESTLFGTLPGSYTGAVDVKGLFEEANHGSLFLDEIGELDSGLQAKFLRVLEDKQVSRLGSHRKKQVEFRLITATNRSLNQLVSAGLFREDLFYRLEVFRLETPPLRAHPEDIPLLSRGILEKNHKILSSDAIDKLLGYFWPGNVRQLFHSLVRACASCDSDIIPPEKILF